MTRKGQAITLSLRDWDKAELEKLALEFGKTWGDKPNISKLIQAIACRELAIAPSHDWTNDRIDALNQVRTTLIDRGDIPNAIEISRLLLDRGELSAPMHQEVEVFVNSSLSPWRLEVDSFIHRRQPFRLSYQDAMERSWNFTITHAAIVSHEEREYLDCWCTETEGNSDLPELQHNWCFRLDRIQGSALIPVRERWRKDFDRINVEFYLYGRLAASYMNSKHDVSDIESHWLPDDPNVCRVVRSIYNTYWFHREMRRHGGDSEIVLPPAVRQRFYQELQATCQRYESQ